MAKEEDNKEIGKKNRKEAIAQSRQTLAILIMQMIQYRKVKSTELDEMLDAEAGATMALVTAMMDNSPVKGEYARFTEIASVLGFNINLQISPVQPETPPELTEEMKAAILAQAGPDTKIIDATAAPAADSEDEE